jgi:hypothetical protein
MSERIAKVDELRGWLGDARLQSYLMAGVPLEEIAEYVQAMKSAKAQADSIKAKINNDWRTLTGPVVRKVY